MQFKFIKSTRFWVMILGSVAIYLNAKGYIGQAEVDFIKMFAGVFISVRTVDRAFEKISAKDNGTTQA